MLPVSTKCLRNPALFISGWLTCGRGFSTLVIYKGVSYNYIYIYLKKNSRSLKICMTNLFTCTVFDEFSHKQHFMKLAKTETYMSLLKRTIYLCHPTNDLYNLPRSFSPQGRYSIFEFPHVNFERERERRRQRANYRFFLQNLLKQQKFPFDSYVYYVVFVNKRSTYIYLDRK